MFWHQVGNSQGNYTFDARFYSKISYRTHFHKNWELLYCIEGSCRIQVANEHLVILQNQMLLIPPYAIHNFSVAEAGKLWVCVFSGDHLGGIKSSTLYAPFTCTADIQEFLNTHLIISPAPDRLLAQACLYLVYHQCCKAPVIATIDFEKIVQIINLISENPDKDLTMAEAARLLGYEYHYFSRLFHRLFSMNFRQFVNLYRIEQACLLLRSTKNGIADIALECGFQTLRSFNRVFREGTGQTPREYRNSK